MLFHTILSHEKQSSAPQLNGTSVWNPGQTMVFGVSGDITRWTGSLKTVLQLLIWHIFWEPASYHFLLVGNDKIQSRIMITCHIFQTSAKRSGETECSFGIGFIGKRRERSLRTLSHRLSLHLYCCWLFFILWQIKRGDPFRHCRANYFDVNYEVFAGILSFLSVTAIMALDISRDNINTIVRQKQRRKYQSY